VESTKAGALAGKAGAPEGLAPTAATVNAASPVKTSKLNTPASDTAAAQGESASESPTAEVKESVKPLAAGPVEASAKADAQLPPTVAPPTASAETQPVSTPSNPRIRGEVTSHEDKHEKAHPHAEREGPGLQSKPEDTIAHAIRDQAGIQGKHDDEVTEDRHTGAGVQTATEGGGLEAKSEQTTPQAEHHQPGENPKAGAAGRSPVSSSPDFSAVLPADAPLDKAGPNAAMPQAPRYVTPPESPVVQSLASSADAVARLLQAFATGDFADLYMVWTKVLATDSEQLRLALQGLDLAIVPWSEVADGFPQSVLDDVVALLSQPAVATLSAWLEDEVLNEIADDASLEVPKPQRLQRMRVAAVIHLLQLRDGVFDESIFAAVLAEAMADSQPATVARLMAAWTGEGQPEGIPGQSAPTPTRSQMRAARAALEPVLHQLRQALQAGNDAALRPALKRLSSKQLADVLLGLDGVAGATATTHSTQPGQRIAQRAGHSAPPGHTNAQTADHGAPPDRAETSLQKLLVAILRADAASDGHDRSKLREAIESHAQASGDPQGLLAQVLDDMVNDRVVDLESISARFASDGEQAAMRGQPAPVAEQAKMIETILPGRAMSMRTHHAGWIERALAAHPPALRASLSALLHHADPSANSVESLPQDLVQKIVRLLAGSQADAMLRCAFDVAQTFMEVYPDSRNSDVSAMQWQYLFVHLFELRRGIAMARLAAGLADYLLLRHGRTPTERMKQLVQRRFGVEVTGEKERTSAASAERVVVPETPPQEGESIYIGNAGQVLAAPYMPRLFSMVGLLEGGRFKDAEAAERAVHLMQLVVTGKTDAPEYQLGLNKILCGVGSGTPIVREIEATDQEKEVVEALIKGMIGHWSAIGTTSVAGLRETFLQRPGALYFKDDAWQLKVQAGPIDMLLDRLPWSFSIIKHPWMERSVHVTWR
jgi:hypothetical protein